MGGCQNYGPRVGYPGTIILTTTHIGVYGLGAFIPFILVAADRHLSLQEREREITLKDS